MGLDGEMEKLQFKVRLLLDICDMNKYPFTKIVIDSELTNDEYQGVIQLLEEINTYFINQKEEGFLNFESLLIHFVGLLNTKLNPEETMHALVKEGYYPSLMEVLITAHNKRE
ncbi:DUF1878 family protein [Aquibacillus rhizosphaerae]|uniref:DUF1878 family protein n=1 Tax=Aquibacillus rhizosphaerae TaxID=3051431 RepID=A0ABT7LDT4_9BACI|nr:DUF1878 family protein [Aquibacillus sp. LR5S19]MDL4842755.1 DUF1878 family protein [Aquibacillus sp. LR5S19]